MALTAQQLDHYRRILTARRDDLARKTVAAERGVEEQDDLAHLDPMDRATASVAKDQLLDEAARDSAILAEVEAALNRIRNESYGRCTECGSEMPAGRLDAIPWAALCIRDQETADARPGEAEIMVGGAPSRVVR